MIKLCGAEVDGVNQIFHADCSLECPNVLTLDGTINQPGTEILQTAADSIHTSQRLLGGILTLSAPDVQFEDPFEVLNQSVLEVLSDGCQ